MEKIKKILIISSDDNLKEVLYFCFDGWGYDVVFLRQPILDLNHIRKISPDVIVVDAHSARRSDLDLCRLIKDDFNTSLIPIITLISKRQLRSHLLSIKQGVDDYLIKPPDPLDLRVRVEMALKRAQYSHFRSPLTGLPGARYIEEEARVRLKSNSLFSFGYLDIDNFKYFNDVYGYINGDKVILQVAYMLYDTIKQLGNKDDFIGHIGGDDFVFITTPDRHKDICLKFIDMFDKVIPFHYSASDRNNGYVVARDRTHKIKKIALMSVSLAIVNRYNRKDFSDIIQVNERLTEIKKYLKGINGSKFMAERRNYKSDKSILPQRLHKHSVKDENYVPLGQILLDNKIINSYQLEEALKSHWKKGILFGEALRDLGFVKDDQLKQALNLQISFSQKISK
ncbi:MAG: diguanylate cyclase [Candidatus Gygaella obscura]|nr:diguanylate cyclase [Candidatus Gygaella obscura]